MTTEDTNKADLATCDRAITELLDAILAHDAARAAAQPQGGPFKIKTFDSSKGLDRLEFEALTGDPVRYALREGLRRVGAEVYRLGGSTEAMRECLERLCEKDREHGGRRGSILDAAWNGIGEGSDRWWS